MTQQIINVGAAPNDGLGDPIRTAYIKCNDNFGELYSRQQTSPPDTLVGTVGDVAGMYAYDENYFYYCYANYNGSSQIWGQISEAGNVAVSAINNGTSNVSIQSTNGNVRFNIAGTSNVAVVSATGITVSNNVTANNVIANTVTGTLTTAAQPNITSVGTLNSVTATGNISGGNLITSGAVAVTGNITGGNLTIASAVVASSFTGDGSGLTGITATGNVGAASQLTNGTTTFNIPQANGNVVGNINGTTLVYVFSENGANVSGYVTATGNITGGNLSAGSGIISTTGNVTAGNLSVSGIFSTGSFSATTVTATANVTGGNLVTVGQVSASGNITGGNVIGGGVVAISNITGGNLSVTGIINSTGNITGGNITTAGRVTVTGNITAGNVIAAQFTGNATQANTVFSETGTSTNANYYIPYFESFGGYQVPKTDTGLLFNPSSNTITSNTVVATTGFTGNLTGNVSATTVIASGNVTGGNLVTAGQVVATGNVSGGNLLITGNIVDTGALTVTTGSNGNITLSPNGSGVVVVNKDIRNGQANTVGNIGSSTGYFNTVFASATSALYADLAENYLADTDYAPGTVLCFGGSQEVTQCNVDSCVKVAGVVSTNPAYQMNSGLLGDHVVALALVGRVPVKVQGSVARGDMMISAGNGRARSEKNPAMGTVIGKALQDFDGDLGEIEVVVGKL
jgi:hypothetical protein